MKLIADPSPGARIGAWPAAIMLASAVFILPGPPAALAPDAARAAEAAPASPWVQGHNTRSRLITGQIIERGRGPQIYAGVELDIAKGWKTYWRNPGDDAGVPPFFDFARSLNLAGADVSYPAPLRFKSAEGDAIGYKRHVVFPVRLTPKDASKPITLRLKLDYGICREICIPVTAAFQLTIAPASADGSASTALAAALAAVPRKSGKASPTAPVLKAARAVLLGDRPRLIFDVVYPGGLSGADLFIEAPDEAYIPQPQPAPGNAADGNRLTFNVDLGRGVDIKDLAGKKLRLTLVSDAGQSEEIWVMK